MKVIIPVAGIGSRLRPHTHTQPKALVPVAGKPILSHIVDALIKEGFEDFIFIIGYMGEKVEWFIKDKYKNIHSHFVVQEPREGIGHAVWLSRNLLNPNDEILIVLGDTIFDIDIKSIIKQPGSLLGVKRTEDPRSFGVTELDSEGYITRLIEKPSIPKSNLALVGIYKILESAKLMRAIDFNIRNNIRTLNEFHLTDGLMRMIEEDGVKIKTFPVQNWYDCGAKTSLLETNAILLKKNQGNLPKQEYNNTIIIPPVSIAEGCVISNSIIGPNVSIGEKTNINYSILKDSIIGSYSELKDVVLHQSVVGSDAYLKGLCQSLNIGDSTEIDFN
jgi:glucose-1-phosphate thymidylyltransferase